MRRPPFSFVAIFLSLLTLSSAVVITNPTATTVWTQTGTNTITWSLLPATEPAPTSNYFQIILVNGTPLYQPALNVSLAQFVDGGGKPAIDFALAGQLIKGDGYRLMFTSSSDASLVYCVSEVFAIGSTTATVAPTPTGTVSGAPTSATSKASTTSTTALHAATAPGGPAEQGQGFQLGFSGSGADRKGLGTAVGVVVAAGIFAVLF